MHPITIIGAGLAGYTVARELRKLDKAVPLAIVTADDGGLYSKPMLSNAFAQNKSPGQLVTQSAAQMATQLNAQVLVRTHVSGIDNAAKILSSSAGEFSYSTLVIATGAQAIRLPIEGDAADQVLSINHIDDYAVFRTQLALTPTGRSARVVILGAGLIGCEFADDLAGAGHAVTLVDPNPLPLAALAAPALSQGLHAALSARGIALQLGTTATRVDRTQHSLRVTLANGTTLDTDIVLSAVGLRPDLTLARAAGLATGRGIVVDATGQTSAPHIYALGDCAEYALDDNRSGTLPYIAPLMAAARAIARTLAGEVTPIDLKAAPVLVKTPSYPLALLPAPPAAPGAWHASIEDGRTICRFRNPQGMLLGFGVAPHDAAIRQRLLTELEQASWSKLA
jgi:rubredoxin-NAD+ reductase